MVSHNAYLNANIAKVRPGEQTTWERWHGTEAVQENFWHGFDEWGPRQHMAWEPTQAMAWEPTQGMAWEQTQAMAWHSAAAWEPTQHDGMAAAAWEQTQPDHMAWEPTQRDEAWEPTQENPAMGSPPHHQGK